MSTQHTHTLKDFLIVGLISLAYILLSTFLVGFKQDQVILSLIFSVCYLTSVPSRKFILGFSVFIVYWIIFDYMKAFPNYSFNTVHIKEVFDAEKNIFGITTNNEILTPNQYFAQHNNTFIDVLCGFFYLCWIPLPLAFAVYLFFKDRKTFLLFELTFFFVNLIGWTIYYSYPAAPPWYVQLHGFDFNAATPGHVAGLIKFDEFFNVTVFQSLYAKGSNVFAAMPSLHSAYPMIVFYYGMKSNLGKMNILFGIITVGIWFAAVYTSHHYTLDVLAGIICAIVGISLFNLLMKNEKVKKLFEKYIGIIA